MIGNRQDSNVPPPTAPSSPERGSVFGRKDVWALFVGGVLIVLLYLALAGSQTIRDEPSPFSPSPPTGPPSVLHSVVLGSLEVKPTKPNGKAWDVFDGLPD